MNYKPLGKSGLRVSELCLGTMTFGEEWGYGADKKESHRIFDRFLEAGGNFLDTANRYTEGTSESYLGEFIKSSGRRNELVVATKYALYTEMSKINDGGNHRKNLVQSVEGSLKRLDLDYIDVLYLHAWDFTTHPEEVMRSLDDMVSSGKVLYLGISDTPAWIISTCNTIADLLHWNRFEVVQLEYSLLRRDAERDLLPMTNKFGMSVTAWAPLAGGALTGKYLENTDEPKRIKEESSRLSEKNTEIVRQFVDIARQIGCSPVELAVQWVASQRNNIIPVVGVRNVEQLEGNLKYLDVKIDKASMEKLDEISAIEMGFPHDFLSRDGIRTVMYGGLQDRIIV